MTALGGYRLREGIIPTQGGGRRYVTDTGTGAIYELNETAWLAVQVISEAMPEDAIIDHVAGAHPDVPRSEIEADVRGLLAELSRLKVVDASP